MSENRTEQGLTLDQLLHFKESGVYAAFMATAGLRTKSILSDLMDKNTTKTLEDVRYLQGELSGVDFWTTFVDKLMKELEDERARARTE